jgi:RimJ/RimL family protein N-acetyltransferase
MTNVLRAHDVCLKSQRLRLRPMTEDDWPTLLRWNQDPEILFYSDGADVTSYSLEQVQRIYRHISQSAFCFIMEFDGSPIGESWLQAMNLPRILNVHPNLDCRRIDLVIGEKTLWNKGLGTETLRTIVDFGFGQEATDLIFGCEVADYNHRSMRAFAKAGFHVASQTCQPPGDKAKIAYDMVICRDGWSERRPGSA